MTEPSTAELSVRGMDCADCARHVQRALSGVPGVKEVEVLLASGLAVVRFDPSRTGIGQLQEAVRRAGYEVGPARPTPSPAYGRSLMRLLGAVFGAVLVLVVLGERAGLLQALTRRVPTATWLVVVLAGGWPVFRNVLRAALRGQVVAHTLMTVGLVAAAAVGEWAAAAVVVFFMRVGEFVERFTTERAREAVAHLARLSPHTARVERDGAEVVVPADAVQAGEVVVVRPGEAVPVDGRVVEGTATVDQAAITGEPMPVDVHPGSEVFAASVVRAGYLRIRATAVGPQSTFGRVVRMVQEAERDRGPVQLAADRFSSWYLPVVAGVALLTFLLRKDLLAAAAVLVVACSCSFALATPVAVLASVGAAARRGVLVKGGRYLELLARADVVLVDKTGTLTVGRPEVVDVVALDGRRPDEVLALAASAEWYSEHPLGEAVRRAAQARQLDVIPPETFEALPGVGVRARVSGRQVTVGKPERTAPDGPAGQLEQQGRTVVLVTVDGRAAGLLALADRPRPGVAQSLQQLAALGVKRVELLTGDSEAAARELAERLGIAWRARLLPEDKIEVVRRYQEEGHVVVMVGDGVNDAPALAQAHVGVAMGSAGTAVAAEAAHVVLLREDWSLVPQLFRLARRFMGTVWLNLLFTAAYNVAGLSLAAAGVLSPPLAAAAQSLPDVFILGNSSRLLRRM
ncbi:MAG: cation-translocating P-type ATPase [Armatimonadota bacterium]|nr:cation-translocating P-type ATPase [Armatimonadota bacterium]MDR7447247.1 cation-translocating P-type ATPase [Armatimonadota bacterium]MDR7461640.1 cation-translocating P-type ATPase [Armatimonadota bacterium]MDR7476705.1 cation-translocating P-type ATPase [Armatimonadota bacterium]MDR7524673.1 cation-translocating P-type ATPase [Armatimonadota bacterium]